MTEIFNSYPPPMWTGIFAGLLGLAFGSFAGLAAWRVPNDIPIDVPRSYCPACKKNIPPWWNIPVVSYLITRGVSRCCAQRIHWRYPVCELTTGLLGWMCWYAFGLTVVGLAAFLLCVFLVILTMIDLEHQLLPDAMTRPLLWSGLLLSLAPKTLPGGLASAMPFAEPAQAIGGAALGYLVLAGLNQLWWMFRRVRALGEGDFKLLAALGAWMGASSLPVILVPAVLFGAVVGIGRIAFGRKRMADTIPFGPFLCAGALVALFMGHEAHQLWHRLTGQLFWLLV